MSLNHQDSLGSRESDDRRTNRERRPQVRPWSSLIAIALVAFSSSAVLGQQGANDQEHWQFVSPSDDIQLVGPLAGIDLAIAKPEFRRGLLRIEWTGKDVGRSWELEIGGEPFLFATVTNGMPMLAGTYRVAMFDRLRPNELQAEVTVRVVDPSVVPIIVPSLDFPLTGSVFPPHPASIRFSGLADGPVWLAITDTRRVLAIYRVDHVANSRDWSIDVPWTFGSGEFRSFVFVANPRQIDLPPSDDTRFLITDDELPEPTPDWVLQPVPGSGN
ncbi:MAG TPA: hypothetical protein DCQ98_16455 [Planctomycetaceae bacterium]|nr:hypothetical protein [Planctomycetaceae bacterium]HRF00455.1 hypothetical protein [Pirellulaceae bacterium]